MLRPSGLRGFGVQVSAEVGFGTALGSLHDFGLRLEGNDLLQTIIYRGRFCPDCPGPCSCSFMERATVQASSREAFEVAGLSISCQGAYRGR